MTRDISYETIHSLAPSRAAARKTEALELRKTMKPLMEKRRRARINDSLNRLKNLILPLTGRDKTRYSKLEKADILELTVRFLNTIPQANTQTSTDSYKDGYKACLQRVSALLPRTSLDQDACHRVNDFIQQSMSASVTPFCQNCCAQGSRSLPQIQQKLLSLKSSLGSRAESSPVQNNTSAPQSAPVQPGPQAVPSCMWRPW